MTQEAMPVEGLFLVGAPRGLIRQGSIDLSKRPVVQNPDGTISTVRSMSIGTDEGEVLIPQVSPDGRLLTEDEAIALYRQTGENLGVFGDPESATEYAQALHEQQAKAYSTRVTPR